MPTGFDEWVAYDLMTAVVESPMKLGMSHMVVNLVFFWGGHFVVQPDCIAQHISVAPIPQILGISLAKFVPFDVFFPCWMPKDVAGTLYLLEASWLCKRWGNQTALALDDGRWCWDNKLVLLQLDGLTILCWVVPPPCNSRKGFTFWFNRGLLLTSFWDCYRVGAVPKSYDWFLGTLEIFPATAVTTAGSSRTNEPWRSYYPKISDGDLCGIHKNYKKYGIPGFEVFIYI